MFFSLIFFFNFFFFFFYHKFYLNICFLSYSWFENLIFVANLMRIFAFCHIVDLKIFIFIVNLIWISSFFRIVDLKICFLSQSWYESLLFVTNLTKMSVLMHSNHVFYNGQNLIHVLKEFRFKRLFWILPRNSAFFFFFFVVAGGSGRIWFAILICDSNPEILIFG